MSKTLDRMVLDAMSIKGLITREELAFLMAVASVAPCDGSVVELGVFNGRSAAGLCLAVGDHRVVAIDDWSLQHCGPNSAELATKNLEWLGLTPRIITGPSNKIPQYVDKVAVLVIDSTHDASVLKEEIEVWFPKLVCGGIIVFHDYGNDKFPDIKKLVDQNFVAWVPRVGSAGKMIAFRKICPKS